MDSLLYFFEGLALIIFGIRFLRKGLDRLFGSRLALWLATMTQNRWQAFAAGIGAGTVAPSSTALSVLSMQMLQSGRIDTQKMLALLLGSSVGMTVTANLLASGVTNETGYLLIIGVVGFQMLKRELYRGIGQCIFSLGLLFLGLHEITKGSGMLADDPQSRAFLAQVLQEPSVALILAVVIAVVLQSSTATIGLAIGLSSGGVFPVAAMIPWVVGTNLGLSVTSLIVGWSTWEGRRLGSATLFARATVAVPLFILSAWLTSVVEQLPLSTFRQIAILQTAFNLLVGLLCVAVSGSIMRLMGFLVAPDPGEVKEKQDFLDEKVLDTPFLALTQATRQVQFMADQISSLFGQYWIAETTRNTDLAKKIQVSADKFDSFNTSLGDYLSRIREGMSQEDTAWQFTLLDFANELESIADVIDKNLCSSLIKRAGEFVVFSPPEQDILRQVNDSLAERIKTSASLLVRKDAAFAQEFLAGKDKFNEWCRTLEKNHFQRLIAERNPAMIGSSPYFLDILSSFRRINTCTSSIAYAFIEN